MAFREITTSKVFVKYGEHKDGDVLAEGKYAGAREGKFGLNYEIENDGTVYSLGQTGQLEKIFDGRVQRGDWVKITYRGKKSIETGKLAGKEVHSFKVEVDDERREALPF